MNEWKKNYLNSLNIQPIFFVLFFHHYLLCTRNNHHQVVYMCVVKISNKFSISIFMFIQKHHTHPPVCMCIYKVLIIDDIEFFFINKKKGETIFNDVCNQMSKIGRPLNNSNSNNNNNCDWIYSIIIIMIMNTNFFFVRLIVNLALFPTYIHPPYIKFHNRSSINRCGQFIY